MWVDILSKVRYWFLGKDVFVCYSRQDGADYALKLASDLADNGFVCVIDQWGTEPGQRIPTSFLRDVKSCRAFVLVATSQAGRSNAVQQELDTFLRGRGIVVPIDLDGSITQAEWWPLIQGLPIAIEDPGRQASGVIREPSGPVFRRILNALAFRRRDQRLRTAMIVAGSVLAILTAGIAAASMRLASAESAIKDSEQKVKHLNAAQARLIGENRIQQRLYKEQVAKTEAEQGRTLEARNQANRARVEAKKALIAAAEARRRAQESLREAVRARNVAEIRLAVSTARAMIEPYPEGSLAVSEAAMREADQQGVPGQEITETLLTALSRVSGQGRRLHVGSVKAAGFNPDGKLIVTAGEDGWLSLTPITEDGRLGPSRKVRRSNAKYPDAVYLSANGRWLAMRAMRKAQLWDLDAADTSVPARSWTATENDRGSLPAIQMSPDGHSLFVATPLGIERYALDQAELGIASQLPESAGMDLFMLSDNGRFLLASFGKRQVRVWDLDQNAAPPIVVDIPALSGLADNLSSGPTELAVSNDGNWLAIGTEPFMGPPDMDLAIRLWKRTGTQYSEPVALAGSRGLAHFSADSTSLLTGGAEPRIWTLRPDGVPKDTLLAAGRWAVTGGFSPDGKTVLVGFTNNTISWWRKRKDDQWAAGAPSLDGIEGGVESFAVDRQGRHALAGSGDGSIRVWQLDHLEHSGGIPTYDVDMGYDDAVYSPNIGGDGRWMLTQGGEPWSATLWRGAEGAFSAVLTEPLPSNLYMPTAKLSPAGHWFLTIAAKDGPSLAPATAGSLNAVLRDLDAAGQPARQLDLEDSNDPRNATFSPDDRWLAIKLGEDQTRVWDLSRPGSRPRDYPGVASDLFKHQFSANSKLLLLKEAEGGVVLVDLAADRTVRLHDFDGADDFALSVAGNWLGAIKAVRTEQGGKNRLQLLQMQGDEQSHSLDFDAKIASFSFDPLGRSVVVRLTSDGGSTHIKSIDLRTWRSTVLNDPAGRTRGLAGFSPDGKWLLTFGGRRADLALWRVTNNGVASQPMLLDGFIPADPEQAGQEDVGFSPNGRWLLIRDLNGATATIWDLHGVHRYGATLIGHRGGISETTFSADDRWLVTQSNDKTARLWFLADGTRNMWSIELRGHSGQVGQAAFIENGRFLVTSSWSDGTVRVWPLDPDILRDSARRIAGRNLEWVEWIAAFPNKPYRKTSPDLPVSDDTIFAALRAAITAEDVGAASTQAFALAGELARDSDNLRVLNSVCWALATRGKGALALPICTKGSELYPEDLNLRDSRALARAVSGDLLGAAADFEAVLGYAGLSQSELTDRGAWIAALRRGQNPFTPSVLARLR